MKNDRVIFTSRFEGSWALGSEIEASGIEGRGGEIRCGMFYSPAS